MEDPYHSRFLFIEKIISFNYDKTIACLYCFPQNEICKEL